MAGHGGADGRGDGGDGRISRTVAELDSVKGDSRHGSGRRRYAPYPPHPPVAALPPSRLQKKT